MPNGGGRFTGSLAFIGAARFQGYYDPVTNTAVGSALENAASGNFTDLFANGASPDSGYNDGHDLNANSGDYWQVSSPGSRNIEVNRYWHSGDWIIYSGSVGQSGGSWTRLSADDGIASVVIGDLSASKMFHLGNSNQHILFVTGTAEQTAAMTGSNNLTYDYDTDTLLATGTIDVLGTITASEAQVDNISVGRYITHMGDTDTKIDFREDRFIVFAGGNPVIHAESRALADGTGSVTFNNNFYDVDFKVLPEIYSAGWQPSFFISGSDGVAHVNYGFESHADMTIDKNKHLYFGNSQESSIEYDQDGTGFLIISGTSGANKGVKIHGQVVDVSGDLKLSGNDIKDSNDNIAITLDGSSNVVLAGSTTILEDKKLYFGSNANASIEHDDDGTGRLVISGSSTGVTLQGGSLLFDTEMVASGAINNTSSYLAVGANGQVVLTTVAAGWGGDGDISSVSTGLGLTGGADSGPVTIGLDLASVIDSDSNNRLLTTDGDGTLTAEANVTYDGSTFIVADDMTVTGAFRLAGSSMELGTDTDNSIFSLSFPGLNSDGTILFRPIDDSFVLYNNMQIRDDKKLYFGSGTESYIEYDESGENFMVISGSSPGLALSGSTISLDGAVEVPEYIYRKGNDNTFIRFGPTDDDMIFAAGGTSGSPNYFMIYSGYQDKLVFNPYGGVELATNAKIYDDKKLYFGTNSETSIEYDENNTNAMIISGSSTAGVTMAGPSVFVEGTLSVAGNVIKDSSNSIAIAFDGSQNTIFGSDATIVEDKKLYFGSNQDSYIEFDDAASDYLIISGTSTGMALRANQIALAAPTGGVSVAGSLTVSGSIEADIITAKQYKVDSIIQSVIHATGSTSFGDSADDTHDFIGAVTITGSLGVNTTNVTHGITLPNTSTNNDGAIKAYTFESYSSERFKRNVQSIENPIEKAMKLRGVSFEWRDSGKKDIGFVAEEVGQIIPEVVSYDASGQHAESMSYQKLTSLLLECIKEQQKEMAKVKHALQLLQEKEK